MKTFELCVSSLGERYNLESVIKIAASSLASPIKLVNLNAEQLQVPSVPVPLLSLSDRSDPSTAFAFEWWYRVETKQRRHLEMKRGQCALERHWKTQIPQWESLTSLD